MQESDYHEIQFYRVKDLQDILRISKATVWNWVKLNTFPSPIKLGKGITVWKKSDIDAWVKTKI
jgi:predicted DNA-binding transcriptional regulator AlpA